MAECSNDRQYQSSAWQIIRQRRRIAFHRISLVALAEGDTLLKRWLPGGQIMGEQGAGKSTVSRLLRSLVDPNRAPIRAMPRTEEDLFVATGHSWVLAYDNLSGMPNWLSDGLCRIATDGAFSTRMLHTNRQESVFRAVRSLILNGIAELAGRPDLASRAIVVPLAPIPDTERQPEDQFWTAWEEVQPCIFWILLNALSSALGHLPEVRLAHYPRMADLIKLMTAAAPGFGWQFSDFLDAYRANQHDTAMAAFESDAIAAAIKEHIRTAWEGTASQMLKHLNQLVAPEEPKRPRHGCQAPCAGSAYSRLRHQTPPRRRANDMHCASNGKCLKLRRLRQTRDRSVDRFRETAVTKSHCLLGHDRPAFSQFLEWRWIRSMDVMLTGHNDRNDTAGLLRREI